MPKVSDFISPLKKIAPNPAVAALLTGGLILGGSRLAYPLVTGAAKHIGQRFGLSDPASQHDIETNFNSSKYKKWVPIVLGGLGAAGVVATSYNPSPALEWGGIFDSWDDPRRSVSDRNYMLYQRLKQRKKLTKKGSDMFANINDQTAVDFGKILPVRMAKDFILNDPNTELYHKGNALDIINKASNYNDDGKMSAGSLFDSALNKVQQNLTLSGIAEAGVRSVIGYGVAKAFTNTICNLVDMPKPLRDSIVSAGMITNVIQGLD